MRFSLVVCVFGFGLIGVMSANSETPPTNYDVYDTIVVGLGAAGATAAAALARAGRRVLALEAAPRLGGRVNTVPFGEGVVELGAEWTLGTEHSRPYDTAVSHNITLLPEDLTGVWYHSDGSTADSELLNRLLDEEMFQGAPEPPVSQKDYSTTKITEEVRKLKPELLKDQDFMHELMRCADLATSNLEGSNSWDDVTTGGQYEDLPGNQTMSWHRYGFSTFIELMLNTYKNATGLPNVDVKLNTLVTLITIPQHPNEKVIIKCKDGTQYVADTVIVTVSLGVLKATHSTLFSTPLPKDKITAIDKISMGLLDKIILSYNEVWWPANMNRFGFMWKGADRRNVPASDEWMTNILGASRPMGSSNTLTLWISGNVAKEVEEISEDILKTKCTELLQKFMGNTLKVTLPKPSGIIKTRWSNNRFVRGSYSFDNMLTPEYPSARTWLGSPLVDSSGAPRVLFAGEATNENHFGTVHGASETGFREAMRLLNV